MDLERFRRSPSGRVIQIGQGEAAYWAYVPHDLPPEIAWDVDLVRVLSDADRALGQLAGLGRALPNPHLLIRPFIRREAVLSSRIEGTQTDLPHLYAYEAGQLALPGLDPTPPEADMREVLNYVHALEYGLERLDTLPVSLRLLRELHAVLMKGVRGEQAAPGEFRHTQNWIGPPGCTLNDATYVPPPPLELMPALAAFETYLHSDDSLPPLMRLALIHYQFEAIHPFLDGNGRIGRLLIILMLVHWDLLPLPLLYLSVFFERRRDAYYRLLLDVSASGAWRDWLLFFLEGVGEQASDAVYRARRLQDLQVDWHRRLGQKRASANLLRLADHLFESPVLSITDAARALDVTYPSAQRLIERLVEESILTTTDDRTYGKTYYARPILAALDAGTQTNL
ncbi:MAG: Fic family protein [Anaerolineae bacterium]|nr:Fic family protein [Anaerolineae bacterium]